MIRQEQRPANTSFASGEVIPLRLNRLCKFGGLCFYSRLVLVDSFVLRSPARTQSPKTLYII